MKLTVLASALLIASGPAGAADADMADPLTAGAPFLEFETVLDGNCQNLSQGGKLRKMRNVHGDAKIRYRLIRYFADVPQWGRATGIIAPADGDIKLGCTLVDGREQRWEVERAEFVTEDS
ncbi:MAG: hypothetical protein HKO62_13935 [Gammaproteobacteria bacterium]|nr:hypothetical protein [Gammaproteobacteria bacterium]